MATGKSYNSIDSKEQLILVQTGKEEFGGYKQDLLVNTLNEVEIEFYVCTQCKGVMRNACQLGEEQIPVCETCVGKKLGSQPMMKARKKIPELRANCPLATRGCKWNATLSEVSQHLDVCQEFLIKCKYDCGVIIKRCELNNHCNNECLNREVSCEHCRSMIVYKELNQHFKECPEFPLLCPNNCATNLKRKQIDSHIETDCPNTVVKCRYERFGCKQEVKRCEMEEHKKTNKMKHLEMTTFFAVNKIDKLEETNYKLSKEVIRIGDLERSATEKIASLDKTLSERERAHKKEHSQMLSIIEELEETNSKLSKEVIRIGDLERSAKSAAEKIASLDKTLSERERANTKEHSQMLSIIEELEETNSKLSKEVIRIGDLERSAKSAAGKIASLDKTLSERERANTKQPATTESPSYPVVLRDTIKRDLKERKGFFCSYDFSWRFINLTLIFRSQSIFGNQYKRNIPVSIIVVFNKIMSPLARWPFEGRFKLTIIDRVNTNNSLVYESAVLKLQPEQQPEQGFILKEKHPNHEFEIATISKDLLLEERFLTENRDIQFTLQIQEAGNVPFSMKPRV